MQVKNEHQPAFPFAAGNQNNPDDRVLCEGLTKREHVLIEMTKALAAEYCRTTSQGSPALVEMIVSSAEKLTNEVLLKMEKPLNGCFKERLVEFMRHYNKQKFEIYPEGEKSEGFEIRKERGNGFLEAILVVESFEQ